MKKVNRLTATILIVMLMTFALICVACGAKSPAEQADTIWNFRLSDKNISDEAEISGTDSALKDILSSIEYYEDDDTVSVMIVVGEGSLAESFLSSNGYESVSDYAISRAGKRLSAEMTAAQERVLESMTGYGIEYKYQHSYKVTMNGFAVEMRYGDIEKLAKIDGIKDFQVSLQYEIPETTTSTDATFVNGMGQLLNNTGYNGEGMFVAIIDSGFDVYHDAFATDPVAPSVDSEFIASVMSATYASSEFDFAAEDVYTSVKFPYTFDYADGDNDVNPDLFTYFMELGMEHGTHVAGIVAGNSDIIKGAAYDAQIAAMKVASDEDGSIYISTLVAALGDAILLGVDAVNISIGSGCGPVSEYTSDTEYINVAYGLAERVGIIVNASAGNDYSAGYPAGGNLPENPDTGVIGAPGSYSTVLTSASMESSAFQYITLDGTDYRIGSTANSNSRWYNFYDILGDKASAEFAYVVVPNLGAAEDYTGLDVSGKIAVVKRGEISFAEKMANAAAAGAIGCIVINTDDSIIIAVVGDDAIPTASVTATVGAILVAAENKVITINADNIYYSISEFSSWGPTGDLDIGIDLTSPGGNVYSAIPDWYSMINDTDSYVYMSGTSMSSPNQTSSTLVIKQYLKTVYPELSTSQMQDLTFRLLMSTARILTNAEGNPVSPRNQGAGMIDIDAAVATDAYITVTGSDRTKLNLGSDKNKDGIYTLKFNLVNIGENALSYDVGALVFSESVGETLSPMEVARIGVLEKAYMFNDAAITVSAKNGTVDGNVVTVEAGQTANLQVVIVLTDENKAYLNDTFANGMYVEGFATLTAIDEGSVDLSIPFISFYGDWDNLPIFEPTIIDEAISGNYDRQLYPTMLYHQFELENSNGIVVGVPIGMYNSLFALPGGYKTPEASYDKIALGTRSSLSQFVLSTLRNCEKIEFNFVDEYGKTFFADDDLFRLNKAYCYNGYALQVLQITFSGLSVFDMTWANNQTVFFDINAYFDKDSDNYQTLRFPIFIDLEAPTLNDVEIATEEGKTTLTMDVYDNHYMMNYCLYVEGADGLEALTPEYLPVYDFNKNSNNTLSLDITKYMDAIGEGNFYLKLQDYALNSAIYEIYSNESGTGIVTDDADIENELKTMGVNTVVIDGVTYAIMGNERIALNDFISNSYSATAEANAEGGDEEAPEFVIENGVLTAYNGEGGEVVVPDGVTAIGNRAFDKNKMITNVILPEGVVSLGAYSFRLCSYLENINFPSTLVDIKMAAFAGCRNLKEIDFSKATALKTIGDSAFVLCTSIKELVIPDIEGLKVNAMSFGGLLGLEKLEINADLEICNSFYIYPKLTTLTINGRLDMISRYDQNNNGGNDFAGLDSIEVINFYGDVGNIGFKHRYERWGDIMIHNSFGVSAMPKLREVNFYGNVDSIGGCSFSNCPNLEKVTFYKNVGQIGISAFSNSPKLTSFTLSEENAYMVKDEETGVVYDKGKTKMLMPSSWQYDGVFTVPETVTTLREAQFSHGDYSAEGVDGLFMVDDNGYNFFCGIGIMDYREVKEIKGVVLHEGITEIPDYCFYDCANLSEINYNGAQITSFGNYSVAATGIVDLIFPDATTYIGYAAWEYCEKLVSVTLPKNLETITGYSFRGCTAIKEVVVPEIVNMDMYSSMFFDCTSLERVEFLNTQYAMITNGMFRNTTSLKEIIGLDNITSIGSSAFYGSGIETYIVPTGVRSIPSYAFAYSAIKHIGLQEGKLRSISPSAFENCINLEEVNIPACLTGIDFIAAFPGCTGIKAINVAEGHPTYASVDGVLFDVNKTTIVIYPLANPATEFTTPDTLTYLGANVMEGVLFLKNLYLPEVLEIGDFACANSSIEYVSAPKAAYIGYAAFASCSNLAKYDIPEAQVIDQNAFVNAALTEVVLGNGIAYLGTEAFRGCANLTKVTVMAGVGEFDFSSVFYQSGVTEVVLDANNVYMVMLDDGLYSRDMTVMYKYFGTAEKVVLPEGLLKISHEAFMNNTSVKEVVFPSTLEAIGDKAFYGCTGITKLEFKGDKAPLLQGYYVEGARYPYANFVTDLANVPEGGLEIQIVCPNNDSYFSNIWKLYFGMVR
ncbi:MAG: leucine-rich repeat protein [Clostridia bacterium]|nr:leucine-rich repeat protein [Clostridia bacterium]